ncbi:MAG: cupin domain-containing protein [Acidimicrobiia bacterium]|nr:cupin domain-containing protein [Acidimicrobiia bacterium]
MSAITVVRSDQRAVAEADATSGMIRVEAFSSDGAWAGLVRTAPARASGWHHHGDYDTYIYVVSGSLLMESGPSGTEVVEAGPGDFVHVPKHIVHRESNPSSTEGVLIGVRVGHGPPVLNVEGPG